MVTQKVQKACSIQSLNKTDRTDKYDEHGSLWYFFPKKEKLNFAEYGKRVGSLNEVKFINQLANQVSRMRVYVELIC